MTPHMSTAVPSLKLQVSVRRTHVTSTIRHLPLRKPDADRIGAVGALAEDRVKRHPTRGQSLQPREQALGMVRPSAFWVVAHSVGDSARVFCAPSGVLLASPGRAPCHCCICLSSLHSCFTIAPSSCGVVAPDCRKMNERQGVSERASKFCTSWIDWSQYNTRKP